MVIKGQKKGEVVFVCDTMPDAQQIYLAGSFNNWDAKTMRMTKQKDQTFRFRTMLKPGRYEYKFLADNNIWLNDPDADEQVTNNFGTLNSVTVVI